MFGQKLKSWMEAHLGRPRLKSTSHQSQKRAQKDSNGSAIATSSTSSATTTASMSHGACTTSVQSSHLHSANGKNSNFDSSSVEFIDSDPSCIVQASTSVENHHHPQEPSDSVCVQGPSVAPNRIISATVSNSNSILSGTFSNNLSSPDTGYSTDGYSPKSVYPALSFESSGKSTPKSSYTISSLVSSELLNKSNTPSQSCSVQNGLELDDCTATSLSVSVGKPNVIENPNGESSQRMEFLLRSGTVDDERECSESSSKHNSVSINTSQSGSGPSSQNMIPASHTNCKSHTSCPPLPSSSSSQTGLMPNNTGDVTMVMNELWTSEADNNRALNADRNHRNHRRTESMDEQQGRNPANSSFILTGAALNMRNSLGLAGSKEIPESNPSLQAAFSVCSPRRERTRIKTNPWITLSHHNEGNSHANGRPNASPAPFMAIQSAPMATQIPPGYTNITSISSSENRSCYTSANSEILKNAEKINNQTPSPKGDDAQQHSSDSSILFRISMSTSTSDSGKGTLEPGTNRHSAESSCLLSDSASTRNSIISQENVRCSSASSNSNAKTGESFIFRDEHPSTSSGPSIKSTPVAPPRRNASARLHGEPKSDSAACAPMSSFGKYERRGYNSMLEKETDILSDWANTDDDGEDEIETDQNDNDTVTPTPSSPGSGNPVILTTSNSSGTDLDFIDSGTAARALDRRHYKQNINIHSDNVNGSGGVVIPSPYHHNMNLPTTCYQALPIPPIQISSNLIPSAYDASTDSLLNQSDCTSILGLNSVTGTSARCFNPRIANSNLCDRRSNSKSSHPIARGAIGFLRKIFKKGTCSTQRNSPESGEKSKSFRSRGKDKSNTAIGLRSPLLADTVPNSGHPLSHIKPLSPAINGYFLTPTPNSFRRRSAGNESSDSKGSKQHRVIKTDIIRLPIPALHPSSESFIQGQHTSFSSSSTSSGPVPNKSVIPCENIQTFSNFPPFGTNTNNESNTNTNSSTTASSVHSMSTCNSLSGVAPSQPVHYLPNDIPYANANSSQMPRQSHFMANQHNNLQGNSPMFIPSGIERHAGAAAVTTQSQIIHSRDILQGATGSSVPPSIVDSPRVHQTTRINSPSFNNYSPIHRLVVTGGNQFLSRTSNPTFTNAPVTLSSFQPTSSPSLPPRNRNGNVPQNELYPDTGNNNNLSFISHTPVINRPTPNMSSPSINHRHSFSSPHPTSVPYPAGVNGHFFAPSPIIRNPRYQYITSSNQNSPVLNAPKRISINTHHPHQQVPLQIPHPHVNPIGVDGSPQVITTFSNATTFSPVPPVRQSVTRTASSFTPTQSPRVNNSRNAESQFKIQHRKRSESFNGYYYENGNEPLERGRTSAMEEPLFHPSTAVQSNHYYSSPVVAQRSNHHNLMASHYDFHGERERHDSPHRQHRPENQGRKYINNGNGNSRRSRRNGHNNGFPFPVLHGEPNERIYETVDMEDVSDMNNSDDGDGNGGDFECDFSQLCTEEFYDDDDEDDMSRSSASRYGHHPDSRSNSRLRYAPPSSSSSKSRRSKKSLLLPTSLALPPNRHRIPRPLPMMGAFLSETETRLLEAERAADRKYKQLISEAEALLKEISIEKSKAKPSWVQKRDVFFNRDRDDCPQSDPLRRKAYDCWALRRLQQELAGCCASPPVLHRSRLSITSPSTPSAPTHPAFPNHNSLSLVPYDNSYTNPLMTDSNSNNGMY